MLSTFGGLMYTLRNVGNACNRKPSNFAIENLLTRKLYSVNKHESPFYEKRNFAENDIMVKGKFFDKLNSATSFYYNY